MSDGSWELQQAVYGVLNGLSPALASGGVHSPAPANAALPYVEIGESDAVAPAHGQDAAEPGQRVQINTVTGGEPPDSRRGGPAIGLILRCPEEDRLMGKAGVGVEQDFIPVQKLLGVDHHRPRRGPL